MKITYKSHRNAYILSQLIHHTGSFGGLLKKEEKNHLAIYELRSCHLGRLQLSGKVIQHSTAEADWKGRFSSNPWLSLKCLISKTNEFLNMILNFLFYIKIQPINNVVTVSGGEQRDSAIHVYAFSPELACHPGCHTTLNSSLCYQQVFVGYPF